MCVSQPTLRLMKSPGCVCATAPQSMSVFTAQDVSKSLLLELAGWQDSAPVCSLTHPTLCSASSSLSHLWESSRFSGWSYFLSLLWVFCSCLCLFLPPVERGFHSKAVLKITALTQSCDRCHHLSAVTGISGAEERGEGEQEHSRVAAQRRGSRKQKVGTAGMCCHAESTRGSTSGCLHLLEWKNKLIYFPRPRKSSSTAH